MAFLPCWPPCPLESTVFCSYQISLSWLLGKTGSRLGWRGWLQLTLSGARHGLLQTDLASVFILLRADCVTLGKTLALTEPQLLHLSCGDDRPLDGLRCQSSWRAAGVRDAAIPKVHHGDSVLGLFLSPQALMSQLLAPAFVLGVENGRSSLRTWEAQPASLPETALGT